MVRERGKWNHEYHAKCAKKSRPPTFHVNSPPQIEKNWPALRSISVRAITAYITTFPGCQRPCTSLSLRLTPRFCTWRSGRGPMGAGRPVEISGEYCGSGRAPAGELRAWHRDVP